MKPWLRRGAYALPAVAALVALPLLASAQAAVTVEVREPSGESADGRVSLTPEAGGTTVSCETRGGSCSMPGVAGGRYVVRFQPRVGGEPPDARVVLIPPAGSVTLRVSTH